jgi:hypothetical protein
MFLSKDLLWFLFSSGSTFFGTYGGNGSRIQELLLFFVALRSSKTRMQFTLLKYLKADSGRQLRNGSCKYLSVVSLLMLIFLLLPFISCSSLPGVSARAIPPVQEMKPRIVFLMMRMTRDSLSGSNSVEMVKKTIKEGGLKKQKSSEVQFGEYLSIEVLEEGLPPHTFSIDHPLVKHVEYEQNKSSLSGCNCTKQPPP